jgi:hypothetical protein
MDIQMQLYWEGYSEIYSTNDLKGDSKSTKVF